MNATWRTPWKKLPGETRARLRAVNEANNRCPEFRSVQSALAEFHGRLRRRASQVAGLRSYLLAARCAKSNGGIAA